MLKDFVWCSLVLFGYLFIPPDSGERDIDCEMNVLFNWASNAHSFSMCPT